MYAVGKVYAGRMIDRFPRLLRALHEQSPQLSAPRPASEARPPPSSGCERFQHPTRLRPLEVLDELAHLEQPVVLFLLTDDDEGGRGVGRARLKITE